ncbi:MAG: DUF420 domain-containing protein [Planctomycetaceae bacterium]
MTRKSLILGAVLWTLVGAALLFQFRNPSADPNSGSDREKKSTPSEPVDSAEGSPADAEGGGDADGQNSVHIGFPAKTLPEFRFDECMGEKFGSEELKGKRWVASFIFTSCTQTCPTITRAVMEVHDRVAKAAPDVMFVSFSVFPQYDTPEVLAKYSEPYTKGHRERWKFLTGRQQDIYELIVKGFGQYVKENPEESRYPGVEVAHSNRVVLVNEDGIPVATFLGTVAEDMVHLRRILQGQEEFPQPGASATGGLTFSSSDGSPLGIQFQVVPGDSSGDSATEATPASPDQASETPSDRTEESKPPETDSSESDGSARLLPPGNSILTAYQAPISVDEFNADLQQRLPEWARPLPAINAGLNSLATVLLMSGWMAIRRKQKSLHRNLMISAFVTSVIFLLCYLVYHWALGKYTGEHGRKFSGEGVAAIVYQLILWPHIILAVFVPLLAVRVFMHAFAERWDDHRRLARITFPIWMFVSVTGVIIYAMLYHWPSDVTPRVTTALI